VAHIPTLKNAIFPFAILGALQFSADLYKNEPIHHAVYHIWSNNHPMTTTAAAATAADELKARKAKIAFVVYGYLSLIMCGYGIMFQLELKRRHQIEVEQRAQYIERLRTSLKAALMKEIMEDDNPTPRKKQRPSRYNNGPVPFNMAAVPPPNIANAASTNLAVNTAAPIAPADPMVIQAARAAKGRRIIESLADGIQVTDVESDAVVYEHPTAVAAAAAVAPFCAVAVPPDAPAWAGPLFDGINNLNNTVNNMNNALDNLANTVNHMNNTLNNLTNTVNSMNNTLSNVEARSLNNAVSMAQDDTTLTALSNAAGFPPTLGALNTMNGPDLTAFASALWSAQQRRTRGIAQPSTTILPEVDWNPSVNGFDGHTFTADKRSREPQQQ
jgi:hypothetical protein